jgi:hypothetical protein
MPNTAFLRQHLSAYGTVWLIAFLLVLAGTFISHRIFSIEFPAVADVLQAIAFFCLIVLSVIYFIGEIFSDQPVVTKLVLCAAALLLFLPLMYAPVLALQLYAFFGKFSMADSSIYVGFQTVVTQTSGAIADRFGIKHLGKVLGVLQVLATVVGGLAAAAQLNQMLRKRGAQVSV